MLDISKILSSFTSSLYGKSNKLDTLCAWSRETAKVLAAEEGITLTPAHWEVIEALRNHYEEYGPDSSDRSLLYYMIAEFSDRGGKKYLYELFPHGPVNQACRIAGLPLPPHNTDSVFGSVM